MNFNMCVKKIEEVLVAVIIHPLFIFQPAFNASNLVVGHFAAQIIFKQSLKNKPSIIRGFGKYYSPSPT